MLSRQTCADRSRSLSGEFTKFVNQNHSRKTCMIGRCCRPSRKESWTLSFRPALPAIMSRGAAHGLECLRPTHGSMRGKVLAAHFLKNTSSGVRPFSDMCGLCELYHTAQSESSCSNSLWFVGTMIRFVHSSFIER